MFSLALAACFVFLYTYLWITCGVVDKMCINMLL